MRKTNEKEVQRLSRHKRVRKKIIGTTERPRVCVHRSLKNFSAQLIDDAQGKVLFGLTTLNKDLKSQIKNGGNVESAAKLGKEFAKKAQAKGVKKVCFDRGGYIYHGRVKAFAEAARQAGMEF